MVTIHEFGHFIVAKLLGIRAEVFSIGFGPRLFGFDWDGTDFRVSALPLGGYVRFRGENLEMIQGQSEGGIDEYLAHARWKRFLVSIAGPAFNIATAIVIPMAAIMIGFQDNAIRTQPTMVGSVLKDSPAEVAGLKPGDKIVESNGIKNPPFEDFRADIMMRAGEDIPMTVDRGGQLVNVVVKPRQDSKQKEARIGIEPGIRDLKVMEIKPGSPGAKGGLQVGDRIIAMNGEPLLATSKVAKTVEDFKGKELALTVDRNGQTLQMKVVPDVQPSDVLGLGIEAGDVVFIRQTNVISALKYGISVNWKMLKGTVLSFKQIFAGRMSARDTVAGPIGMAKITADVFNATGWSGTILLMGFLSMSLGVMNLLPIPVLDGGAILIIFAEALLALVGKTMSMVVRERLQQAGFAALLLLMGFVFYNDIARVVGDFRKPAPVTAASPAPAPK